jgi:hypothetical protein
MVTRHTHQLRQQQAALQGGTPAQQEVGFGAVMLCNGCVTFL